MRLDSVIDLDGVPSKYYPRFRPRRLVMPVDPNDVHSEARHPIHPFHRKKKALARLQKSAERRGAINLAEVPAERTVGDAFRLMLENWESWNASALPMVSCPSAVTSKAKISLSSSLSSSPWCSPHLSRLYEILLAHYPTLLGQGHPSDLVSGTTSYLPFCYSSAETNESADQIWDVLNRTPLTSPIHGALALRGKSLVECILLNALYDCHSRLRTIHAQQFLHECCGLLSCGRIALRLGLGQIANVETEINMWREINILTQRVEEARRRAAQHRERAEKGVTQQRRWYWRAVLKSAAGRLKMFPVHREDIQPRMEWIRQLLYSFVAFLEVVLPSYSSSSLSLHSNGEIHHSPIWQENNSDGPAKSLVEKATLMIFAPSLLRFMNDQKVIRAGMKVLGKEKKPEEEKEVLGKELSQELGSSAPFSGVLQSIRDELHHISSLTAEEREVMNEGSHPLNRAADRRREQFESSGGAHSMEAFRDDLIEKQFEYFDGVAAPSVVHSTRVVNALKEAQLILQYSPLLHPSFVQQSFPTNGKKRGRELSRPLLNVEQVIRRTVEVHETNPYATLTTGRQQFRPVEYRVCRLFYGRYCLGEGKGESLIEAIQMAAQQMVCNYYLRGTLQPLWEGFTSIKSSNSPTSFSSSAPIGSEQRVKEGHGTSEEFKMAETDGVAPGEYEKSGVLVAPPVVEEELQF